MSNDAAEREERLHEVIADYLQAAEAGAAPFASGRRGAR